MFNLTSPTLAAALAVACLSLTGCGHMSDQTRDTAIGAGIGGVAGSVLTDGGTLGTIGGAVIGGAIGHERHRD